MVNGREPYPFQNLPPCWRELAARAYHKRELLAPCKRAASSVHSRHELQARASVCALHRYWLRQLLMSSRECVTLFSFTFSLITYMFLLK